MKFKINKKICTLIFLDSLIETEMQVCQPYIYGQCAGAMTELWSSCSSHRQCNTGNTVVGKVLTPECTEVMGSIKIVYTHNKIYVNMTMDKKEKVTTYLCIFLPSVLSPCLQSRSVVMNVQHGTNAGAFKNREARLDL